MSIFSWESFKAYAKDGWYKTFGIYTTNSDDQILYQEGRPVEKKFGRYFCTGWVQPWIDMCLDVWKDHASTDQNANHLNTPGSVGWGLAKRVLSVLGLALVCPLVLLYLGSSCIGVAEFLVTRVLMYPVVSLYDACLERSKNKENKGKFSFIKKFINGWGVALFGLCCLPFYLLRFVSKACYGLIRWNFTETQRECSRELQKIGSSPSTAKTVGLVVEFLQMALSLGLYYSPHFVIGLFLSPFAMWVYTKNYQRRIDQQPLTNRQKWDLRPLERREGSAAPNALPYRLDNNTVNSASSNQPLSPRFPGPGHRLDESLDNQSLRSDLNPQPP